MLASAGSSSPGRAVRALCGAYCVPSQDHDTLPPCPQCKERYDSLPS